MAFNAFRRNRFANIQGAKIISDKAFYLVIAAVLFFGFAVNAVEVFFFAEAIFDFVATGANLVWFFVGYVVMGLVGICINVFSRNPAISFLGYCLVVLPIGAILALVVPSYSFGVVRSAFFVTVILSAVFGLFAILYPRVFYSVWKILALSLLIAMVWSVVALFTGAYFSSGYVWLDWLIVLIFCCYIGFDISLARNRPKTMDNAVDSACGLYLDIVNVFLRLLIIFGRHD